MFIEPLVNVKAKDSFPLPDRAKISTIAKEERQIKEENIRLQRKLLREMERREALSRQLSESESSIEMDDERSVE